MSEKKQDGYSAPKTEEAPPRLMVGIPSRGPVHIAWAMMLQTLQYPVGEARITKVAPGMEIAAARNNMVLAAQEANVEYLFFIDDDVTIPSFAPRRMLFEMETHPEWDMLTGVYCTKSNPPEPLIFRDKPGAFWDWRLGETFPITGAGMGCALIRMTAFDRFKDPWFRFHEHNDGVNSRSEGEDMYFCRRLREEGGTIMCDGAVICGHIDIKTGDLYRLWEDTPPVRNALPEFDGATGLVSPEGKMRIQAKEAPGLGDKKLE